MTDLYDQRIDAMKARARAQSFGWDSLVLCGEGNWVHWDSRRGLERDANTDRLAAYKRKRFAYEEHEHLWAMNDKYGLGYKRG